MVISKDHEDLAEITEQVRKRFGHMIRSWNESLTKIAYKFETYDLIKLLEEK